MHFTITDTNVRDQLAQSEIEATVAAAVEVLVPALAREGDRRVTPGFSSGTQRG